MLGGAEGVDSSEGCAGHETKADRDESVSGMISLDGVGLRYSEGRTAAPDTLRDITFTVPQGGFRWLRGPSGAGKSSLLRLLQLAVRPHGGRMYVLGTDIGKASRAALPALRLRIGMVFQDFRLLPHLSAFDNVALPLRLARRPEPEIAREVVELLRWVGLAGREEARPHTLSGGEQQRVAIARAVIGRPDILLADEPSGNLDDAQAERSVLLLRELNHLGTTVIIATHNGGLVERHPGLSLVMEKGRLISDG
jgi:cell division transport system ATP-binding protein